MKKRIKFSRRTMALLAAAALLLTGGAVSGTRAALNIQSDYYIGQFYLNHLQVHLIENGTDVCGGHNNLNGSAKVTGNLATSLGYEGDDKLGSVEPGKVYQEEIAAENGSDIDEFVRMTVRKYWVVTDEDGKPVKDGNGNLVKAANMDPAWIHLMYGDDDAYNTGSWQENTAERTEESRTYYYKSVLGTGSDARTAPLFDAVKIDGKVASIGKVDTKTEGNKTIYNYIYKYDGSAFFIEADVQAIQTHNINQAVKSQWGVDNVTGSYNEESHSGSLSVN